MEMIKSFKDKKVLITGHTGFKGSWLTLWMKLLGAKVMGCSYGKKTTPSNFDILKLKKKINSKSIDVRNFNSINKCIHNFKPDYIFHLAAQPIVSSSYSDPIETISSNVMGTANILEALKISNHKFHLFLLNH